MSKANIEIENLISVAQKAKNTARQGVHEQIKMLEIQRQKHLFEAKYECLIEVTDAIVEGADKIAAIHKGNLLCESLQSRIQKFIDSIIGNIDKIDTALLARHEFNYESEEERRGTTNLEHWKECLQGNIAKIIDIYKQPVDPSKNAHIEEKEYVLLQQRIEERVLAQTHFFQSVKRVEDKEVNKFFDKKIKELEDSFLETLKQINSDLTQQIVDLALNTAMGDISLNKDHLVNAGDAEEQVPPLGDSNLEPDSHTNSSF